MHLLLHTLLFTSNNQAIIMFNFNMVPLKHKFYYYYFTYCAFVQFQLHVQMLQVTSYNVWRIKRSSNRSSNVRGLVHLGSSDHLEH